MRHAATDPDEFELELAGGKYSPDWWKDTGDRVISTVAQTALAVLSVATVPNLLDVDLFTVAAVSATAGVLAFLKALAVTRA